jgi:regulator of sirC expression with transglutaminase-like and TPR domain
MMDCEEKMSSSQKTLKFYKELKPEGLKKRTKESWDKRILADLKRKYQRNRNFGYGLWLWKNNSSPCKNGL